MINVGLNIVRQMIYPIISYPYRFCMKVKLYPVLSEIIR